MGSKLNAHNFKFPHILVMRIKLTPYDIFIWSDPWAIPFRHVALKKAESILSLCPTAAAKQPWPCFENRETPATVAHQCGPWARRGKILSPSCCPLPDMSFICVNSPSRAKGVQGYPSCGSLDIAASSHKFDQI